MHKIRVAIYIRVSTQEQADEGHSIPMQTERLKKYCEAKGWTVVKIYTDPGFSGSNTNRPALTKMLKDIEAGLIDLVLVYKLDRLSRSQKDTLYLIEDVFLKHNVDFVSMNENFDTSTPFGRAMIGILSVFAQLEREQIRERMAMGHIGRAKEGYWHGGSGSPIGYDFINGELIINEYEAMQVREIFDLFIKGNTLHGIANIMKSKYTNRYSSWNNANTVGKILRNTTYIGLVRYKGKEYDGQHVAIVSPDIFKEAQLRYEEIDKSKNSAQKTPFKGNHLLSGLMFCGNCGARYFTQCIMNKKSGTYFYYKCYSRDGNKEMKKMDGCKNPTYREEVLDNYVIEEIKKLALNPSEIDKLRDKHLAKVDGRPGIIQRRIKDIEKQINKLMDLYQFGTIPIADIGKRVSPLQEEKQSLELELDLYNKTPILNIDKAKELINSAEIVFSHNDNDIESKRLLINKLISKIIIYDDSIEINWKFII